MKIAINRSRDDNVGNPVLVFEIYVNSDSDSGVPSNIDTSLGKGGVEWSDFEEEQEVLILPNFCFTTLDISESGDYTLVKVAEIPYQETFQSRPVSLNNVLWIDPCILQDEDNLNDMNYFQTELKKHNIDFSFTEDIEEGINMTKDAVNTVIIASNAMGQTILQKVDTFQNLF